MWHGILVIPHLGSMPISTTPCRQIGSVLLDLSWCAQLNYVNKYAPNTVLCTSYIYCVLSNLTSTEVTSWRNWHNKLGSHRSPLLPKLVGLDQRSPSHRVCADVDEVSGLDAGKGKDADDGECILKEKDVNEDVNEDAEQDVCRSGTGEDASEDVREDAVHILTL